MTHHLSHMSAQRIERSGSTLSHVVLIGIVTSETFEMASNRDTCAHAFLRRNG